MKLPFDFAIKLVFRLLIPGFIIATGFLPVLNTIADIYNWSDKSGYLFIFLVILSGWLIIVSDMPIYMLLEGRRFWPDRIKKRFRRLERRRLVRTLRRLEISESDDTRRKETNILSKLEDRIRNLKYPSYKKLRLIRSKRRLQSDLQTDTQKGLEAAFDIRNFPIGDSGDYFIQHPSRLGNVLAAFEDYSLRVYGIDSIFWWGRLWLKVDKDTREEIDNSQAIADSSVYTSFALYFTGLIWLAYAFLTMLQVAIINYLPSIKSILPTANVTINQHLPNLLITWLLSPMFLLLGFIVYRLSLRLQAQFGEIYKSFFDVHQHQIEMSEFMKEISELTSDSPVVSLNKNMRRKAQFRVVTPYLQYYRYSCPKCGALLKPNEIKTHHCRD